MEKCESRQIKGIAIILMYIHHLFGCGTFLVIAEENTTLIGESGVILAYGAKICISIFVIISGYGIYKSYLSCKNTKKWLRRRILNFLLAYWVMLFLLAIPYLLWYHKFNLSYMFVNLFALLHNDEMLYLSFSWYVKVYLEILILLPLTKKINQKLNPIEEIFLNIIFPCSISAYLIDTEAVYIGFKENLISSIRLFLIWYPVFYVGNLFAKYHVLENVKKKIKDDYITKKGRIYFDDFIILLFLFQLLFYRKEYKFSYYTDIIVGGIFILLLWILICRCETSIVLKTLEFLGRYSFQYWLISGMFFLNTTEFQWILFIPRNPILILIWKFIFITPFAIIMKKISDWASNQIFLSKCFKT